MRTAYVIATVVGVFAVALLAEPWIKSIEFHGMLAEKHGRVVDADTRRGIPGVTVTAIWTSGTYDTGWAGSSGGCDLERVSVTDANGDYTIPDVYGAERFERIWWKQLLWRGVGATPFGVGYNWHLVPFKATYVRVGDESHIAAAAAAEYQPDRSFSAYWNPPSYLNGLRQVEIEPIVLRKTQLGPTDEIIYDYALYMRSVCSGYPKVRETMKARLQDLACSLPEDELLDPQVVRAFFWMAVDSSRTYLMGSNVRKKQKLRAGDMCDAGGGRE